MDQKLLDYIRQYRGLYTREAINHELISNGFSQGDIDAAWTEADKTYLLPRERRGRKFWLSFFGFLLLSPLVIGLVGAILYKSGQSPNLDRLVAESNAIMSFFLMSGFGILLYIIVFIVARTMRQTRPEISRGLTTGIIVSIAIPFIPLAIIFGICIVTTSG